MANLVLDIADKRGIAIYRTSLLKLIYFAHGWCLAKYGVPLVGQPFEAWQHGPVLRVVYDQLSSPPGRKVDGRLRVLNPRTAIFETAMANFEADVSKLVADVVATYGSYYALELSDLTHEAGSPWISAWEAALAGRRPGARIENREICEYFLRQNDAELIG